MKYETGCGKLIDAYYTLGDSDGIIITEFPADVDALTVSMADIRTTSLIQISDAVKAAETAGTLTGAYRGPGQLRQHLVM